jgi:CRP-like cAMP-binding protein
MSESAVLKEFLARTPFFGGLDSGPLDRLIGMLVERKVDAGASVFCEGELGRSMYVVRSGEVVALQGDEAQPVKLMRFRQGDFFGETTLIEMQPRPFTAVADQPSQLYELTSAHLYELYQQDIHAYVMVLQNINRELCRRVRGASARVSHFATQFGDEETQIRDPFSGRIE